MWKIRQIGGKQVGSSFVFDTLSSFVGLKAEGYGGVYILASKDGRDNPNINQYYDLANEAQIRAGLYIELSINNPNMSCAKQFQDLMFKYGVFGGMPPAIVITSIPAGYSVHQILGDVAPYFKSIVIDKVPTVVLGLSRATKAMLFAPSNVAGDDTASFKAMMTQDKVRLWYFRYGIDPAGTIDCEPWKTAWILGVSATDNLVEYSTPDVVDTTCPANFHWDANTQMCVADDIVTPPPAPTGTVAAVIAILEGTIALLRKIG